MSISPGAGVTNGEFVIEGSGFDTSDPAAFAVLVDEVRAPLVALSPRRVIAVVPEMKKSGAVDVRVESSGQQSEPWIDGPSRAGSVSNGGANKLAIGERQNNRRYEAQSPKFVNAVEWCIIGR